MISMTGRSDHTLTSPAGLRMDGPPRRQLLTLVHAPYLQPKAYQRDLDGRPLVIGRSGGGADLQIEDEEMSRAHAELMMVPPHGGYLIRDLGSKNGTTLNGEPLSRGQRVLEHSAVIGVGQSLLVFSDVVAPQSATDAPIALARAYDLADRAAPSSLPVVVHGPSGAGKEVLARRIHQRSGRRGAFVAVNCAAFTRELIGSELFGHVMGAFSGATADRRGVFVRAHAGTLFLDEIADLPIELQPTLLRALQEGVITPIGADRDVEVDVRVIAASHQDLEELAENGLFRQDLFARLAAVEISVPPLSKRRDEILPLFTSFLGDSGLHVSFAAARALLLYDWPRNVRELQHTAKRILLFADSVDQVPVTLLPERILSAVPTDPVGPVVDPSTLDRATMRALLRETRGNIAALSRKIGVSRQRIYRLLDELELTSSEFRGGDA